MRIQLNSKVIVQCVAIAYFAASFLTVAYSGAKYIMVICSILIALCAAVINKGKLRVRIESYHLYTVVFLTFCFISMLWAVSYELTLQRAILILQILVVMFLIYLYYQDRSMDDLLMVAMIGGYLVSLIVLVNQGLDTYLNGILTGTRIYNDEYINANSLGMLMASSIVINFYYFIYKRKVKLWYLLSVPAFICLLGAGSRKSILLLIGGVLILIVLNNMNKKKFLNSFFKIVVLVLLLFFGIYLLSRVSAFGLLTRRFETFFNYFSSTGEVDYSTRMRVMQLNLGIQLFKENPIVGVGIDNPQVFNRQITGFNYLHNNFVELLAGGGIIGFCLYYSMYGYLLYNMLKYRSYRTKEFDICLTLLLLHLILEYGYVAYFNKETYFYFMIFFLEVRNLKQTGQKTVSYSVSKKVMHNLNVNLINKHRSGHTKQ